uniref:Tim44/TimA family putative adaptor protein n=1 Tax=Pararhizobium sp. IMCC3301 TaxID=3067904 RepID=UPI002741343F|nr:Tim44/TimA family putative adaptor protein [Pararhizobium sp. IMCC3301]
MQFFDFYTLIFVAIAVFFFLRLRGVLGKRTGQERRPYDPYADKPKTGQKSSNDNVINLPKRSDGQDDTQKQIDEEVDPKTVALNKLIAPVLAVDPDFDPKEFVAGARVAYEMIVTAYAAGNRTQLKPLLSSEVYDGFEEAIAERESRSEAVDFTFVGIEKARIVGAEGDETELRLTIRFVSELISATRNQAGDVIDGSSSKVTEVTDIWTFARDPRERDPNWRLVATEAAD